MFKVNVKVAPYTKPPVKGYLTDSGWDLFLPGWDALRRVEYSSGTEPFFFTKEDKKILRILPKSLFTSEEDLISRGSKIDMSSYISAFCEKEDGSSGIIIPPNSVVTIPSGISIEWPELDLDGDFVIDGVLRERSSLTRLTGLSIQGGQIDYGYTGEIHFQIANVSQRGVLLPIGVRFCQLIFRWCPIVLSDDVKILKVGSRGNSGLGSTGKK